jgi:hypothetical protein
MDDTPTRVAIPADRQIRHFWPFSLLSNTSHANTARPFPSLTNDVLLFDENSHVTPRTLLLDIDNDLKSASPLPLLAGKIIYSFELDGTTIEHPNADKALGMQNVLFADSAIPFERTIFSTKFHPRTAGSVLPPLKRAVANATRSLPAASLLHDRTKVYLPSVPAGPWSPTHWRTPIVDPATPTHLPGFTKRDNVDWIRYAQSFIGFRTTKPTDADHAASDVPGMDNGRLHVWSPYTYITYEDSDDVTVNYSATHRYWITNLRSFFGTDYNLVEMKHPFEALPVS